jgi:hypothetical protein
MIVAGDAIDVMPPYLFFLYMLLPAVFSWLLTTLWIQRCWMRSRIQYSASTHGNRISLPGNPMNDSLHSIQSDTSEDMVTMRHIVNQRKLMRKNIMQQHKEDILLSQSSNHNTRIQEMSNIIPVDGTTQSNNTIMKRVAKVLISPFPYAVMFLMAVMIALIFVDIMSIAGLICCTAVVMTMILVLGNHWQGLPIFGGEEGAAPLTAEEKIANTSLFFDELFESIDYSLLIIFLGLFIVVDNIASTGIPKACWDKIVGKTPFDTFSSVAGICVFILAASQFLGNVPVIQLALPNVEPLPDAEKRYAWAIISFVATVGGNLTITGSAANIIVAEKAARIDPNSGIDFFRHYAVCFWVTLFSCIVGALMITATVMMDNNLRESW